MPDRVVVVGASVGGIRAAQALRTNGFAGEVIVVGAENELPYDKPPLSKQLLTGEIVPEEIRLASRQGLIDSEVRLQLGAAAGGLDLARRRVQLTDGNQVDYDTLVIATGVRPRTLPATTPDLVSTVRDLGDSLSLRDQLLAAEGPLVVVGGGFIGAEIAASARTMGVSSTVVEAAPVAFSQALGPEVGGLVQDLHQEHGVDVVTGTGAVGIERHGHGHRSVHLSNGRELRASVVVAGIGCVPNTEWLATSGLTLDDGVLTDEHCQAEGAEQVFALGDVARWYDRRTGTHRRVEHWTHAFQQAQLVAHNIINPDDRRAHTKAPYFWSDQHGVKIQMAGHRTIGDDVELLRCPTPMGPRDVALYSHAGMFTAGVVFGWPQMLPSLRRAWEEASTLDDVRKVVLSAAA